MDHKKKIFDIGSESEFENAALELFTHQSQNNKVYHRYIDLLGITPKEVDSINKIPFLPIEFFKTHKIVCSDFDPQEIFLSSSTTGTGQSKHYVRDLSIYEHSFTRSWELHYGSIKGTVVLALLPSYLERDGSSLIYMANAFIEQSGEKDSGFFLNEHQKLLNKIEKSIQENKKILLLGVSFALLDFVEKYNIKLPSNAIVMETGGMKGRRREMIREELHKILCNGFGVKKIHSEYSMTELLSQAYSKGDGIYTCPPWMKIVLRDASSPLDILPKSSSSTGTINIIDLANIDSCSFIATADLGRVNPDGGFEVLGRTEGSDVRGCNLLVV